MPAKPTAKSFHATLEREHSGLGWTIIRIPFNAAKVWKMRGRIKVRGEINGFPFRTTLFSDGKGGHTLLVNKKMQAGAKAFAGMSARFRLEPDFEERRVVIPSELNEFLAENKTLRAWFAKLNYSIQKFISDRITDVKNPEVRARRAEQTAEHLLATMEGERELPPILQAAFTRDPRAREGWNLMSPTQRRGHLFGILGYKNPESRGKRLAKAMAEAVSFAGRKTKR
jgi:uncharacterized protein YdeI (YjbR/CyaY-like superfamily)